MPDSKSKAVIWTSYVISAIPVFMLLMSAYFKFAQGPDVEKGMMHLGWEMKVLVALAITEISCTLLYLIPQTAVLGAVLLTGYLGGATATHVRVGDPFWIPIVLGMLVWLGLWLRDDRLKALLPLRK
jgi:hypothetical protein